MKRTTSTIVRSLVMILIGISALTVNLQAQDERGITVRIPFAFSADGRSVAAGTYRINLQSSDFLLSILNVDTGNEEVFAVRPEQEHSFASRGLLIFHQCEGRDILSEVHIPGGATFSAMIQQHRRKDVEANGCSVRDSTSIARR